MKKQFYYGDGTDHIVELTQAQADATNHGTFHVTDENPLYGYLNLPEGTTVDDFNSAADILNNYLKDHTVYWRDTTQPVLRPV